MKRLVFATNNNHKLDEARAIMAGEPVELVSLKDIGCNEEVPETSATLAGNALQKARYVHDRYGVACIADDTGLMVDSLNGEPGVYSARYAGPGHDSAANMALLLANMKGKTDRKAHFSTVVAYVDDTCEQLFEGRVDGVIAEEPHGNGGFGYDPLFVPEETGVAFAEMTPEDKNSISHRGRAMRRFYDWFRTILAMLLILVGAAMPVNAEQWRYHASYDGATERIIDTPDVTYILTLKQEYSPDSKDGNVKYGALLCYDKKNDEWRWLNRTTGLSENIVVNLDYDYAGRLLVVAYDNGNIDLVKDNGGKVNIPGLKMAGGNMSSDVAGVTVSGDGSIWIATASGYVSVDAAKGEIRSSRNYGRGVKCVSRYGGWLFVSTDQGVLYGDETGSDLNAFTTLDGKCVAERFFPWGDKLCYYGKESGVKVVKSIERDGEGFRIVPVYSGVYSVERGRSGFVTGTGDGIVWRGDDGSEKKWPKPAVPHPYPILGALDDSEMWFAHGRTGFSRLRTPSGNNGWTFTIRDFFPNAANAFMCTSMAYSPKYGMMVRNHGNELTFGNMDIYTPDLICALKDGEWKPLSITYCYDDPDNTFLIYHPKGLAIDPKNEDHVYNGSLLNGMLRLDLAEPGKSLHLSRSNDYGAGKSQFIATDEPSGIWPLALYLGTPVFDSYGVLWTTFNDFDNQKAEIRYWLPDDRLATTSAANYHPMGKLKYQDTDGGGMSKVLPLTTSGRRNVLVYDGGTPYGPIMVIDHNATPSDKSDDRRVVLSTLVDQDGITFNYGRASMLWEDKNTGRVWVPGEAGIYYFDPADALNGKTGVRRVKVSRNDGTNLADYLLDGAYISSMTSDPSGCKWFGTLGAGIVVTSSDGTEIMKTYKASDSELADDNIYGMCYNPENSSMMISTGRGLCEVFLDAALAGSGDSAVRAYPNPVRPGYVGMVTVDGLPFGATVKITDAAGNTVKDLGRSNGGEVAWDLSNNNYKRVPAGVYLVLATNGPDQDAYSKMTKILVVE